MEHIEVQRDIEERDDAELLIKGVCSYDPNAKQLSEIEIREWSKYLRHRGGGFSGSSSPRSLRQYESTHMRVIS